MLIDMHVHPLLYREIYTPGDAPDGFSFWEREFGMGHMGPMDWDEIEVELDVCRVDKSVLMPLDVTCAAGGRFGTNEQIAALVAAHPDRQASIPVWGMRPNHLSGPLRTWGQKGCSCIPLSRGSIPVIHALSSSIVSAKTTTSQLCSMLDCPGSLQRRCPPAIRWLLSE